MLSPSRRSPPRFCAVDEDEGLGQLDQLGDEVTFVQADRSGCFRADGLHFLLRHRRSDAKHWRQALRAGSTVLDLSGALDQETGVLVRSPWVGAEEIARRSVYTRGCPGASCGPGAGAADGTAATGSAGSECGGHGSAARQRVWPGRDGRAAPADGKSAQLSDDCRGRHSMRRSAYNLLCGLGENAKASLSAVEARIRRQYQRAGGQALAAAGVADLCAPVFHGHSFRSAVELERAVDIVDAGRGVERRARGPGAGRHGFAVEPGGHRAERCAGAAAAGARPAQCRTSLRACGCGPPQTICGCMRRMPWSARWSCGG